MGEYQSYNDPYSYLNNQNIYGSFIIASVAVVSRVSMRRISYNALPVAGMYLLLVSWKDSYCFMMTSSNKTFSALLALCAGNSPVICEFPSQRPVMRNFDVFFNLCLNKQFSKHSWGWWFETSTCPLWRQCNVMMPWQQNASDRVCVELMSLLSIPLNF